MRDEMERAEEREMRRREEEAALHREEAERRRQAERERAERDRERRQRVAETRRLFKEKLAEATAQVERIELTQQRVDDGIEALERRIREDPFLDLEFYFDRAFDADWPTLRSSIFNLINADEGRAAVSMQRKRVQLAAIPEFAADDELVMRMLSADESTAPNLADLARELLLGD
jgi:uncharacterized membrane protein YqiK